MLKRLGLEDLNDRDHQNPRSGFLQFVQHRVGAFDATGSWPTLFHFLDDTGLHFFTSVMTSVNAAKPSHCPIARGYSRSRSIPSRLHTSNIICDLG